MRRILGRLQAAFEVFGRLAGNPDLRNLEIAFLGFNAVEYGTWIAILLYAYESTGPSSVGFVALVLLIPSAVSAPIAAALGDRMSRRQFLVVGYVAETVSSVVVTVAIFLRLDPLVVYALACVDSAAFTMTRPGQAALLPELAERPEELTAANGLSSLFEGAGILVGPLGAAAILAFASPAAVFLAGDLVLAMATVLALGVRRSASASASAGVEDDRGRRSILHGFALLMREPDARVLAFLLSARMVVIGALDVLFVLIAFELFEMGPSGPGLLNAALGAGLMVGGAVTLGIAGRRNLGSPLVAAALAFGACFGAIGVLPSNLLGPALIAVAALGLSVMDATGRTQLQRVVSEEMLARVFGVIEGLGMAALGVGSILVPALQAVLGLRFTIIAFGVFLPASVIVSIRGIRRIDATVEVPERAIALLTKVAMFAPLRPQVLESLARRASWRSGPAGSVVMAEGEPGDRYYILASGRLEVTRGGEPVGSLSEPGDGVGEIALLHDVPRTATVVVADDAELLALDRADFLAAVTGHPDVARAAERQASDRMPRSKVSD